MSAQPSVTVLMSIYNDLRFVPQAVDSVLAQSHEDFEFLIIDDGSDDGSGEYLAALQDPRVRVLRHDINRGLTVCLKDGLAQSRGRYVARMDADDVCHPDRLRSQIQFMDASPEVGILGSARVLIDESGKTLGETQAPADHLHILWKCLLGNPFAHPTVMLRREILTRYHLRYDPAYQTAQDYELWSRMLLHTRGANLPERLLSYRLREGMSKLRRSEQIQNHDRIALQSIQRHVPEFSATSVMVRELRGRYGGWSVRERGMDPRDQKWIRRYEGLVDAFATRYSAEPGIERLSEEVRQSIAAMGAVSLAG